jgi:protoporphyrin/coproporphyrin ferrochelatase
MKTGILLINLGTPDAPKAGAVARYLREFLGDERVIDIPWLPRKLLVNGIIAPIRSFRSAREYKKVWTDAGSPLLIHGENVRDLLQTRMKRPEMVAAFGGDVTVELAMRYQNPSMDVVLKRMQADHYDRIVILPLYAQYASASTGSTLQRAFEIMSKWYVIPDVTSISQYWDFPGYLDGFELRAQLDKVYDDRECSNHSCEDEINDENRFCYKATCYATTRALAERLQIPADQYTVCFQSRLGSGWVEPFSDKVIEERAEKGDKKLLVFSPAFVADCLETIVEIGEEYVELFQEKGGEQLDFVPSLNDHPRWIQGLEELVLSKIGKGHSH